MSRRKRQRDSEKGNNKSTSLDGFPNTAKFIAKDRDKAAAIFRRFDTLSYRNLLYLQSKISVLQERLDICDAEDAKDRSDEAVRCATSWEDFEIAGNSTSNNKAETPQQTRWRLCQEIKIALKEYRK